MLGQGSRQREPWEGRVELGQRIVGAEVIAYPQVRVIFADGYSASFDFGWMIEGGKAFAPLRDRVLFASVHPSSDGSSLEWIGPDGEEIDLGADALRMQAEGLWDPQTRQWTR